MPAKAQKSKELIKQMRRVIRDSHDLERLVKRYGPAVFVGDLQSAIVTETVRILGERDEPEGGKMKKEIIVCDRCGAENADTYPAL